MNVKKYITGIITALLMIGSFAVVWYLLVASPWVRNRKFHDRKGMPRLKPTTILSSPVEMTTSIPSWLTELPKMTTSIPSWSIEFPKMTTEFPETTPSRVRCPINCENVNGFCDCRTKITNTTSR